MDAFEPLLLVSCTGAAALMCAVCAQRHWGWRAGLEREPCSGNVLYLQSFELNHSRIGEPNIVRAKDRFARAGRVIIKAAKALRCHP